MKGRGLPFWILLLAATSCGLETVPSLNTPNIDYNNTLLNGPKSLSFVHEGSRYAGSDFLGYQFYYKIYPLSSTGDFARLLADRTSLSNSPTVNLLTSLGYQSFTFSSSDEGTSTGTENLFLQDPADGVTIALDFTDFLANTVPDSQPLLKLSNALPAKPYLYRTASLVGSANQTFGVLRTGSLLKSSLPVDIASTITQEELNNKKFEVNVFAIAYGLTPTLVEVYSSPVPWGVIQTITP